MAAKIVGFSVDDVPHLSLARDLNLGDTDLKSIEIVGNSSTIEDYHRPVPPETSYSYRSGGGGGGRQALSGSERGLLTGR